MPAAPIPRSVNVGLTPGSSKKLGMQDPRTEAFPIEEDAGQEIHPPVGLDEQPQVLAESLRVCAPVDVRQARRRAVDIADLQIVGVDVVRDGFDSVPVVVPIDAQGSRPSGRHRDRPPHRCHHRDAYRSKAGQRP